jgi:hypothetical protein
MPGSNFVKDNLALVVGIALPVLLVIVFGIATVIPKITVPDPQYDMIYTTDNYDYSSQIKGTVHFDVKDNKLRATFRDNQNQSYRNIPRIYYFDVSKGSIREMTLDVPGDLKDGQELEIEEAENYKLSKESLSPDGYRYDNRYRGHGDFFFMGGSGYSYGGSIRKESRAVKIPAHDGPRSYGSMRFMGWVLEGGKP